MKKTTQTLVLSNLFILLVLSLLISVSAAPGLETSSVLLKVSLKKDDTVNKFISVSSNEGGEFILAVENLPEVILSEDNFVLEKGERRQIGVQFNSAPLDPGVYVGRISILNNGEVSTIPVIFEVESTDVFFDINLDIPPQFTQLQPGDKLISQVKIFDLISGGTTEGLGPTTVEMAYFLYDLNGNVLSSETESIVVEGQTTLTKTLTLPSDIKVDDYIFSASATYQSSVGTSSSLVSVVESTSAFNSLFEGTTIIFVVLILAFLIIFLAIIILFAYFIHDRNRMILELRKYNSIELQRQKDILKAQETILKNKKNTTVRVKQETQKKIKNLREKQQKRIQEFRQLEKKGNVKEMKRKLDNWKKQGYDTLLLESRIKGLSTKEMQSLMKEWKRQGYTSKTEEYKKKK